MRRGAQAGFSLLELVIVLVVMGLLTSLVLPAVGAGLRNWQLRNVAAELVSNLRLARADAVTSKLVQAVRLDLDHDRVDRLQATELAVAAGELERFAQNQLAALFGEEPGPIDFSAFGSEEQPVLSGAHYILFYPRGNSTGGRVTIRHREDDRTLVVTVAPVTGRVEVEKRRGSDS